MGQRALRNPCEHMHNGSILLRWADGDGHLDRLQHAKDQRITECRAGRDRPMNGGGEKGVEIIFLTADLMRCRGVRDVTWGLDLVGNNDSVYWLGNEEWEWG